MGWIEVVEKEKGVPLQEKANLDGVPSTSQHDNGYLLCRS